jgi:hypothetical protein
MKASAADIRLSARMLASDGDIMRMYSLTEAQLARFRNIIDAARTQSTVNMKFARANAQARRIPLTRKPAE